MKRRLGMVVGVLVMGIVAFLMRSQPVEPAAEPETPDGPATVEPDSHQPTDDELGPRRSVLSAPRRVLEAPRRAEFTDSDDAPHGMVRGVVEDRLTGAPVEGAELTFENGGTVHLTQTDVEGRFRFASPAEGLCALALVEADGFFPYAPTFGHTRMLFTSSAGEVVDNVAIRLEAISTVQVHVHDPNGELVTARLRVLGMPEGSLAPAEERFAAPGGVAAVRAPEDSVIEARTEGLVGRGRVDARALMTGTLHIHLDNRPTTEGALLSGQVLSLVAQAPIANALVEIQHQGTGGDFIVARITTDEDGRFSHPVDEAGPFTIWAVAEGYAGERRVASAADESVILLAEEAALVGRVLDEDGRPVSSFLVFAEAHLGALERHLRAQAGVFDAEGDFQLRGLSSGGYTVSVAADGFAPATREVLLARGETARVPDFQLTRGATVRGEVRGEGGAIAGARVQVESAIGGVGLPLSAERLTDAGGLFFVGGLSPGHLYLSVAADGHHARIVAAEAGGEAVVVTLNPVEEGEETRLELAGIGAALRAIEDALVIDLVVEGGGAEAAGLRVGEAILAIDGSPTSDFDFQEAISRIRGPVGSTLRLQVNTENGIRDVDVTRVLIRAD